MVRDENYYSGRFSSLWKEWLPQWQASQVHSADWKTQGLCISTVARICNTDSNLARQLEEVITAIAEAGEASLYVYPQESLHLSLLGCAPRKSNWTDEQVAESSRRIVDVVKETLNGCEL